MKIFRKILSQYLPRAWVDALEEQFNHLPGTWQFHDRRDSQSLYDLVLSCSIAAQKNKVSYEGVPILTFDSRTPVRLGSVMSFIARALQDPLPYMDPIQVGPWQLVTAHCVLYLRDSEDSDSVSLTAREAMILAYCAARRGQVVSRDDMLTDIWHYQGGIDTHTLETHIYRLRQKMKSADSEGEQILQTREGGYCLV